ncbi:MAG: phosphatidylglycerophosphatase A [Chitinivibrionales bacterium]|nr:phosphatidylglycerophosphatase A [Chitinivibrionales bacterium]
MKTFFARWTHRIISSVFFAGYFPFASGTVGSAVTVVALYFVHRSYPHLFDIRYAMFHWIFLVGMVGVSIIFSRHARELYGGDDPGQVVIDEVAGQLFVFFMLPLSWRNLLLGFLLFRFFDIVKPFPANKMEEMDDGVGITMDDVVAGIYANLTLFCIRSGYHWVSGLLHA